MTILIKYMNRFLKTLTVSPHNSRGLCKKYFKTSHKTSTIFINNNFRYLHDDNDTESIQVEENIVSVAALYEETPAFVRNALYPENKKPVLNKLVHCTCIQEALDIIKRENENLSNEEITQATATFWDLIKVLHYLSGIPETRENVKANEGVLQLHKDSEFQALLILIEKRIDTFNVTDLSYVHLYLIKLGLDENHSTIKLIMDTLKQKLMKEFCISSASRFVTGCFTDYSLKSHFNVQPFIPSIIKKIDNCKPEEIKFLTICISTAYAFVTDEILHKYKISINNMIENSSLHPHDYKAVLKILTFLNNSLQRERNIDLIRKCCVLIKRKISEMNASEVCILFEIFHANQESAEILNEIQRNATKHFLQMEEESNPDMYLRLKLLSVLVTIASPHQRHQYHNTVVKYAKENLHPDALYVLRKILSEIKTSDKNMCNKLWDQIHRGVAKSSDRNLLKLVSEYTNFNTDIVNYRHIKFENMLTMFIDRELNQGIYYHLPSVLAHISLLYIPYSNSRNKLTKIINALCKNWFQLNSIDWLKISKAVQTAREVTENDALGREHCIQIKKACDSYVMVNIGNLNLTAITLMLKCYILREEVNNRLVDYLLIAISANAHMSSISLKNIVYCLRNTHSYYPEVLDRMCNYVCENSNHLLGNTIEKYLYFCYYTSHHPQNLDKLFQVVTDVLIRDTERMNGLTYLQAALALCYFHKLPQSFIKHIFNVSFLEKLDVELAACYAKETYPFRVRHLMMQLNRAVCLDYPEANVPWFHEKYIQERRTANEYRLNQESVFYLQVYESLLEITGSPNFILKSTDVPYGYYVDFILALNARNEITDPLNSSIFTRFAFLLPKAKHYLRFGDQLIGQCDLKKRHLEILGYKVAFINWKDWWLLASHKDKVVYIKSIIWPDKMGKYAVTSDR